jgi:general secretion pathway protein I
MRGGGEGRSAGFTLLEVLVAFAMLALVLGAAYASFGAGTRAQDRAASRLAALTVAESALDRLGGDVGWREGRTEWREGGLRVTLEVAPHRPGERALWAAVGAAPWRATATVARDDGGAPVSLTTLRLGPSP